MLESSLQALRRVTARDGPRPAWRDGVLPLALLAISLGTRRGGALNVVLEVALVAPLLWRRRAPVLVFTIIWAVAAVQGLAEGASFSDAALLVAFYTVATGADRRTTILAGTALGIGIVLAVVHRDPGAGQGLKAFVALAGLATAAGVLGLNVRNRRLILAGLHERAERLEQEHEREVALAKATERTRIAQEMHDVIAHNVSVMVALCDGAAYHVHDAPERVASALEQASRTGRQALAELRQTLGVLRDAPADPALAPLPGIRQIEDLVQQIRAAGVPVNYTRSGELRTSPPGLELAVYRIVQEALTNTLKHAGGGARATVTVACAQDRIEIEVTDTGLAAPAPRADGAGLRGMHERASVYGGDLQAGPGPSGGWRVRASLGLPAGVGAPS